MPGDWVLPQGPYEPPDSAAAVDYANTPNQGGVGNIVEEAARGLTPNVLGRAAERGEQPGASGFDEALAAAGGRFGGQAAPGTEFGYTPAFEPPAPDPHEAEELPAAAVNEQYAPRGPDGKPISITDQPMSRGLAQVVGKQKTDEVELESRLQRTAAYQSWPVTTGVELAVGLLDPVNLALGVIPGVGEAAVMERLASAGLDGLGGRMAARAIAGAGTGVAQSIPLVALQGAMAREEGDEFGMREALNGVFQQAVFGAAIHAGIGTARELGWLHPDELMTRKPGEPPQVEIPPAPGSPETRAAVPETAYAPERADALAAHFAEAENAGQPVDLKDAGFAPHEIEALKKDGLAHEDGTMSQGQFDAWRDERELRQPMEPERPPPSEGGGPAPRVADGFVRFYHGGDNDPTSGGGRWVTTDPAYARDFRSSGTPKKVWYVDVPKGDEAEVEARQWDEQDEKYGMNNVGTYRHTELPERLAKQMKPLATTINEKYITPEEEPAPEVQRTGRTQGTRTEYTIENPISGEPRQKVAFIQRADGKAVIQTADGVVTDVSDNIRRGQTPIQAIAETLGDHEQGAPARTDLVRPVEKPAVSVEEAKESLPMSPVTRGAAMQAGIAQVMDGRPVDVTPVLDAAAAVKEAETPNVAGLTVAQIAARYNVSRPKAAQMQADWIASLPNAREISTEERGARAAGVRTTPADAVDRQRDIQRNGAVTGVPDADLRKATEDLYAPKPEEEAKPEAAEAEKANKAENEANKPVAGPGEAPKPGEPAEPAPIRSVQQIIDQERVGAKRAAEIQTEELLARGKPITTEDAAARKARIDAMPGANKLAAKVGEAAGVENVADKAPEQVFEEVVAKLPEEQVEAEIDSHGDAQAALHEEAEKQAKEWIVYHGTPHAFDQFDVGKIGTGEGAQAYGHGIYFAEAPGVANEYRQQLAGKDSGHLLTVRIKATPEEMLDWDRPIDAATLAKLEPIFEKADDARFIAEMKPEALTGETVYKRLASVTSPEEASRAFHAAGLRGIRYLDQGSRGSFDRVKFRDGKLLSAEAEKALGKRDFGAIIRQLQRQPAAESIDEIISSLRARREDSIADAFERHKADLSIEPPTRNVVVFDHNDVEITHRNGVAVEPHTPTAEEAKELAPEPPAEMPPEQLAHEIYGDLRPEEELSHEVQQANSAPPVRPSEGGGGEPGAPAEHPGSVPAERGPRAGGAGAVERPGEEAAGGPEPATATGGRGGTGGSAAENGRSGAAGEHPVAAVEPALPKTASATPPAGGYTMLRPDQLHIDPVRFQYKEANERGVTGVLAGTAKWEPALANPITAWQDADGTLYVVNGHQRTDLARRAVDAGQEGVEIPARIFRAADGYTPEYMRALGAYQNIAEGSGTAMDAARILRAVHDLPEDRQLPDLPPRQQIVRDAKGLAALHPGAWGAVENGIIPAAYAARIGEVISDEAEQIAALDALRRAQPATAEQARIMVEDIRNSGFLKGAQTTLFGDQEFAHSLIAERAQVLERAMRAVRRVKGAFRAAVASEEELASAGNKLATEANIQGKTANERLLDTLGRDATTRGPISDELTRAAGQLAAGKSAAGVTAEFLDRTRRIIARGEEQGVRPSDTAGGGGPAEAAGGVAPARATDLLGAMLSEGRQPRRAEPTIRNDERQAAIPGTGPSAVQAQAARDQTGRGALRAEGEQKPANEGLFARPEKEQPGLALDPETARAVQALAAHRANLSPEDIEAITASDDAVEQAANNASAIEQAAQCLRDNG